MPERTEELCTCGHAREDHPPCMIGSCRCTRFDSRVPDWRRAMGAIPHNPAVSSEEAVRRGREVLGHHWRDGWTFMRLENGDIRVRLFRDARCDLLVEEQIIPSSEWASIVEAVSGERDNEIARLQRELAAALGDMRWLTEQVYRGEGCVSFCLTEPQGRIGLFVGGGERAWGSGDTADEALDAARRAAGGQT